VPCPRRARAPVSSWIAFAIRKPWNSRDPCRRNLRAADRMSRSIGRISSPRRFIQRIIGIYIPVVNYRSPLPIISHRSLSRAVRLDLAGDMGRCAPTSPLVLNDTIPVELLHLEILARSGSPPSSGSASAKKADVAPQRAGRGGSDFQARGERGIGVCGRLLRCRAEVEQFPTKILGRPMELRVPSRRRAALAMLLGGPRFLHAALRAAFYLASRILI